MAIEGDVLTLPPNLTEILGVGDMCSPIGLGAFWGRFPHREVRHEMVRGGSVPVPLPRGRVDRVSRPDLDDLTIPSLYPAASLGDVQGLADRVRVPSGPGTRREPHRVDPDPG